MSLKRMECQLTTDEWSLSHIMDAILDRCTFPPMRRGSSWGFNPTIMDNALVALNKYTLNDVADALRGVPHFDYVHDDVKSVLCYVSTPFKGLGARHLFVYRLFGEVRAIVYSYYTNNPYLHLTWHYLYNPIERKITQKEREGITNVIKEQMRVFAGEQPNV